jgi:hypothetical protein
MGVPRTNPPKVRGGRKEKLHERSSQREWMSPRIMKSEFLKVMDSFAAVYIGPLFMMTDRGDRIY